MVSSRELGITIMILRCLSSRKSDSRPFERLSFITAIWTMQLLPFKVRSLHSTDGTPSQPPKPKGIKIKRQGGALLGLSLPSCACRSKR